MPIKSYLFPGTKSALIKFKLAIYLWLIIIILALVAVAPLNHLVRANLSHLYLGQPAFIPFELHLIEIFIAHQDFFQPYLYLLLILFSLTAIIFIFLDAALFGRMITSERKITFSDFLADGSRYFWSFFLSTLLYLPIFILFFLLSRFLAFPLNIWAGKSVTEWPVIISSNLKLLLFILLWTASKLIFDLIRIIIIKDQKTVLLALRQAWFFLSKHFFSLWGLYLLVGLIFVLISIIFLFIGRLISAEHLFGLVLMIILAQAYIVFRLFIRMVFIGFENSYYEKNRI
ncbi:MAG: hypothetical protein ACPLZD_04575 [Candidatus Saccharicenans sp.]